MLSAGCSQAGITSMCMVDSQSKHILSRQDCLRSLAAMPLLPLLGLSAQATELTEDSIDPASAKGNVGVNPRTQRLYSCQTLANCVSVSAIKNPSQFGAPWDYTSSTKDAEEAWKALKRAVKEDATLRVVEEDDAKKYLHAITPSKVPQKGIDDVEFLLIPSEKIVTYRSASRSNAYVYPYQTAISDGGNNKKRMKEILARLGWVELNYAGDGMYSDEYAYNPLDFLGGGDRDWESKE